MSKVTDMTTSVEHTRAVHRSARGRETADVLWFSFGEPGAVDASTRRRRETEFNQRLDYLTSSEEVSRQALAGEKTLLEQYPLWWLAESVVSQPIGYSFFFLLVCHGHHGCAHEHPYVRVFVGCQRDVEDVVCRLPCRVENPCSNVGLVERARVVFLWFLVVLQLHSQYAQHCNSGNSGALLEMRAREATAAAACPLSWQVARAEERRMTIAEP